MANNTEIKKLTDLLDELGNIKLEVDASSTHQLICSFWEYYKSHGRQSYHEVTEYILKNMDRTKEGEKIPVIAGNLKMLLGVLNAECQCPEDVTHYECKKYMDLFSCEAEHEISGSVYSCDDYKQLYRYLLKLYDHIQLEFIRWSEVKKETDRLSTTYRNLRKQLKETKDQQLELEEQHWSTFTQFDEVKEQTRSMYMQIISILGIFAAIVIAVFGGLNVINSISSAFLQGDITIYRTILVTSMCTLFVLWVIFTLLGMVRWFRFEASPTRVSIIAFILINIVCLLGIVYSLIQSASVT